MAYSADGVRCCFRTTRLVVSADDAALVFRMTSENIETQVSRIGAGLSARVNEIGAAVAAAIRRDVAVYRDDDVVSQGELIESCTKNVRFIVAGLVGPQTFDTTPASATGDARAHAGVPLPAVMAAYRVGSHHVWQALHELTGAETSISAHALLSATERIWEAQDVYTEAMVSAYRDRATRQVLEDQARRTALTEALFAGSAPAGRTLWEIADLLELPTRGPYVIVAAATPELGRYALAGIANKLRSLDIYSAWQLLPELEIGIAYVASERSHRKLFAALTRANTTSIGVSPRFDDLAEAGSAVRYARIALKGANGDRRVVEFENTVLGIAAVSDPEVSRRLAEMVLGGLRSLPDEDSQILCDTFRSWVAHRGSIPETAADIYCHPNTVRHRLHRIEDHTGRSVTAPVDIAELCLAFEIDTWLG
jgi:PucR C-terminal helix-turn-helix domain/GGDEF-like domain